MESFYQEIEESCLRTWGAVHTNKFAGLLLRTAGGCTKRSNSVSLLHYAKEIAAVEQTLLYCEQYYKEQHLPVIFKLIENGQDQIWDQILAGRNYECQDPAIVKWMSLSASKINEQKYQPKSEIAVTLFEPCDRQWAEQVSQLEGWSDLEQAYVPQIIQSSGLPTAGIIMYIDQVPVASALAVHDDPFIAIYKVFTSPAYRRQGIAGFMMQNLLDWGKRKGAEYAYLQVVATNQAACKIYDYLGFKDAYLHWYRVQKRS